jgi:hypothetical protein
MLLDSILGIGEKLIDKLIPDPKAKAEALFKLKELEQSGDLTVIANQVEIAKLEAQNPSLFVSGWRPFVGWVCASGFAMQFVLLPLLVGISAFFGHHIVVPELDLSVMVPMLLGMLGLGGLRTVEKLNGVAAK